MCSKEYLVDEKIGRLLDELFPTNSLGTIIVFGSELRAWMLVPRTRPASAAHGKDKERRPTNRTSRSDSGQRDRGHVLQRTVGNQAVQRLVNRDEVQPKVELAETTGLEREAERVATAVLQMNEPVTETAKPDDRSGRKGESREQRRPISEDAATAPSNEEVRVQPSRLGTESGRPLPPGVRSLFEPRLGMNLNDVRVHAGTDAADLARSLNAKAFTHGADIYFGQDQYRPFTTPGKALLVHELAHVRQQTGNGEHAIPQPVQGEVVQRTPDDGQTETEERERLFSHQIIPEMGTVESDFDSGAILAEGDIVAAARADAQLAKSLFSIAMTVIVPGVGGVATRAAVHFGVTVTRSMQLFGAAVGEGAKQAGESAIDSTFRQEPRGFFTSVSGGVEAAMREQRKWLSRNRHDRERVPTALLAELAEYWEALATDNEPADWAEWLKLLWDRYQRQVAPIGESRTEGLTYWGVTSTQIMPYAYWIELPHGTYLALVERKSGRRVVHERVPDPSEGDLEFVQWIGRSMEAMAIGRMEEITGQEPIRVSWRDVNGIPIADVYRQEPPRAR